VTVLVSKHNMKSVYILVVEFCRLIGDLFWQLILFDLTLNNRII